ncbi:ABC transporter C family member 7, partial [Cucurbita argyrosperma subsp. argyrosperma]
MGFFDFSMNSLTNLFFHDPSSPVGSVAHFLLEPNVAHGLSGLAHLVLFLVLFFSWACLKLKAGCGERQRETRCLYDKGTYICCLVISVFSLVFFSLDCFYWYRNGWSEEHMVTLLDFGLKAIVWGTVSFCLHSQVLKSGKSKFAIHLRVWWVSYFVVSCYCLAVDLALYRQAHSLPIRYLVSDIMSIVSGLLIMYVGFFGKSVSEQNPLEEHLLNGESSYTSLGNGDVELKNCRGDETVTPYETAGIWSILSFSWMGPLISTGSKKALNVEASIDSPRFSLIKGLLYSAWKEILLSASFALIYTLATYVGPYLIDTFVQYLNGSRDFENEGYVLVCVFFLAKLVECLAMRHWFFRVQQIGLRVRAALVAMIYNKGLTLSCQSRQQHTSGEIINFMTVDAERVGEFSWYMHDVWLVVFQVVLALLVLYKNLGLASIAAFVATIAIMLINVPLGKLQEKFQDKIMESKDARMKATSEILRNMRILKLQGWEMKFLSKISELRNIEAGWLKRFLYTLSVTTFVFWGAPTFVSVVTFGTCMLLGIPLESGKVLSALATFRILQEPIYNLPDTISMVVQTKVSLDRIVSFLRLDDLQSDIVERLPSGSSTTAVEIVNGSFSWDSSSSNLTLRDINFKVEHGMRVAVCGSVGSGKSSLLSCILGEIPKMSGNLTVCGTKAYVAQSPWIQSGKIEENILFSKEMNRESSKTVIYVTHQVEFLPAADLILVMKDGKITQAGKYDEILRSGTDFMALVGAHEEALSAINSVGASASKEDGSMVSTNGITHEEDKRDIQDGKAVDATKSKGQLVQAEEREKGSVGFSVYWKYITSAYGGALVPLILLGQILFQILQIGSNYWMAWATPVSKDMESPVSTSRLIIVYVALAFGSSLCILMRSTLLVTAGFKAATELFLVGIIAVMSQVAWQVFIIFIPVMALCIWYEQYYISAARELARLIGVCKAPVIQLFSETISGSTTIRSFEQESRFQDTNMKLTDAYSRPKFHNAAAMEWLCFRLDMLSSITFASSLIFLISIPVGVIDPGVAGLSVTYGLNLNMLQAWLIWNLCSMENKIISVERIFQYTSIPSEPPLVIEENRPDSSWPAFGEVELRDLQVRYAPQLPLVLRGITCTFPGGKKTGIVGRTGSGKSTLIQTLFRIVDPVAGHIVIDNIDITTIGLHDLRSKLSIIPQDPTMFEGTVRSNLDPLEEYADEDIWEALDKCQLGDEVRKKEGKLDSAVTENGENWSMGQRQLVCLGRVLLKKSKVLVLDEATASVDTATDNLIQQTLQQHFSDCTVITIAHRITSVLHSDMVLLLSHGLIEEYDTPTRLLEDKSSSFSQLVAEYTHRSGSR